MVIKSNNFDLQQITDSGQCFRMNKEEDGYYSVIAFGNKLYMKQLDEDSIWLGCGKSEFNSIWWDYFDLATKYQAIIDNTQGIFRECAEFGSGIRILKQDLWEVIASFIISQNNNIPRIKSTIEKLCERFGEERYDKYNEHYFTFPNAYTLSLCRKNDFEGLGLGYRDEYIMFAATWFHALELQNVNVKGLGKEVYSYMLENCTKSVLLNQKGIGEKVASCIRLFGCHDLSEMPVDTHIKQWFENHFEDLPKGGIPEAMKFLGYEDCAGVIQQYVFYKELMNK